MNKHLLYNRKLFLALALFGSGCGKTPPTILEVEGSVRLDGQPLHNVEVRFIPMNDQGSEYLAKGITDKEGKFKLTCKGKAGACAGENRVVIREAEIPAHLKSEKAQLELAKYLQSLGSRPLPQKYTNLADNPLVADVNPDQKEYHFDLTRNN